ncbi:MAG: NUDIX hydrolase [Candidatus Eremiobacteraeota bacterium]|nr:NUDIX hydrolase [Candidatus Eremiobacteraeota bacterium]MBV9698603.1 NUDIX hydrolase [Candidatus Eremiobacteraeota bacterium]
MEKPRWQRRSSRYIVDSPYMRLRVDELVLPNGTIAPEYYVRESPGYATIMALTPNDEVVLVRQYRYGSDAIHLELPAGMLQEGEDPRDCAIRELAEETGYATEDCRRVAVYLHEPVRSPARAYVYLGLRARKTSDARLDPTEHLQVEVAPLQRFREMLRDGTIDAGGSIAAGYCCLDYLRRLGSA